MKGRVLFELERNEATTTTSRCQEPDLDISRPFNQSQCLCNIAVVRYDDSAIQIAGQRVVQEMHGQIHIRTFFFRSYDAYLPDIPNGFHKG